ncbi:MAG TPA: ABC transporter substrate-binding protein [Acidimicrobiales bacterium]|nr:ABC transporter substrate-binding protein [Acidimicrobiales bacterium]
MTSTRFVRALVAAALVVLAACGSRVQGDAEGGTAGGLTSGGLRAAPSVGATTGDPSSLVASDGTAATASGGGSPGSVAPISVPGAPAGQAGPDLGASSGPGFTEDEIYIGYLTWNDVSNAGATLGYAVDYGDQERIARAIADDLNARGGIAGRQVVIVFYDYDTAALLTDGPGADQSACSRFVEDRRVFAVIAVTGPQSDVLPQCLYDNEIPLIANDNIPYPRYWFEQWAPFIYSTGNPMMERLAPVWLQRADAAGYFEGWDTTTGGPGVAPTKIGVIRADAPSGEAFRDAVGAALRGLGHEIEADFALTSAVDTNGMSSAVLQFRSSGVTHVIVESLFLLLFPQAAESQRYRPRYTVTTGNAPLLIQTAVSPQQLNGAVGVGYFASYDVDNAQDPGDPSPAATHCREIQREAGNNPDQRESWNLQSKACDAFSLIAEAVRVAGVHPRAIADGAAQIESIPPAGAFDILFGPGRADGPGAVRDLAYDLGCECFAFTSDINHPLR